MLFIISPVHFTEIVNACYIVTIERYLFIIFSTVVIEIDLSLLVRYAYADEGYDDFGSENSLSLIKPVPVSPRDGHKPDYSTTLNSKLGDELNGDLEQDKRE